MTFSMKNNLLAVDVGNTSVLFAFFSGRKLVKFRRVAARHYKTRVLSVLRAHFPLKKISAVVIASVVPPVGSFLKKEIPKKLGLRTLLIGRDIQAPILNKYKNPKQVGMDRLMNALAAFQKYKKEAIVIDFGTAITFDVVSRKGEYLGGVIAPGIEISLEALFQRTALLPKTRLLHPKSILGADTVESIRAGCSFGIGGLCDRVVDEIKKHEQFKPVVIATGGYARFMSDYCRSIHKVDPMLTLQGILFTYQTYQKNSKKFLTKSR